MSLTTHVSDNRARFLTLLSESLREKTFVKLTLGKYRGDDDLRNIYVTPVELRGTAQLSFVARHATRDVTVNRSHTEGMAEIDRLLGGDFRDAHLFTTARDAQLSYSKKGKTLLRETKPSHAAVSTAHDRTKRRLLSPERPFLHALGITDAQGQVIPAMSRKWAQINAFLEIVGRAVTAAALDRAAPVHIVDFGAGKGYLTFAVHDYLRTTLGLDARVVGVELRGELVALCNGVVGSLGLEGIEFHQGDIADYAPERIDVMIALHACDTATDLALHKGITAGAGVIIAAPCCHKEIRRQIESPDVLRPILRYGVHMGREADMVTDTLRALLLEEKGYTVQIFEFVPLEHTSKNTMILAVKEAGTPESTEARARIEEIKAFYGVKGQELERLLGREKG